MAEETPAPVPGLVAQPAEQGAQLADLGEPSPGAVAEATPKKRRAVRTRTLFAVALVLGVVGGVAGGYTVQARREPTALPPLSVAQPVYPRSPLYDGTRPSALPANADDATTTGGDLTKLLLPTPPGATAAGDDHDWMSLAEAADTCADPANCFSNSVADGVARIADTSWNRGDGFYVEIRIFQYRAGHSTTPDDTLGTFIATDSKILTLPADSSAVGYEYKDKEGDNDDHAMAVHGDLAVYFWVTSPDRVPDPSIISGLITQQMARL